MKAPSVYCLHIEDKDRVDAVTDELRDYVDFFGVGMDLHMEQPDTIATLRARGLRAYAHFLYYDIEEVVAQAAASLVALGYHGLDVHALCGYETIAATCKTVHRAAQDALLVACVVLPNQIDLPWRPAKATLAEAGEFAVEKARLALEAGADGVLTPYELAEAVAKAVPSDKRLFVYADPESIAGWPLEWGAFYDWHVSGVWRQDEGIRSIKVRRPRR